VTRYDVGVIGAGPSGAWTAHRLAARGVRVLLVDHSHPREKPCGGGVTGRALAIVRDAFQATSPPSVSIRSARFVDTATGASASVPLNADEDELVVTTRAGFDAHILEAATRAGATHLPRRVLELSRERTGFVLHLTDGENVRVDRIVGADGANSLARRRLTAPFRRDQLSAATGFFVHGCTSTEVVVEFVADPPGYLWSFPRPDHLAIGICAAADGGTTVRSLRDRARAWIDSAGLAARGHRLEAYSWPIPSLSGADLTNLAVGGDRWVLVGDAAGLVDPITREGIFFALRSAEFAADALSAAAPHPERDFDDRVHDEIVVELQRAAAFKARFFQPRFTGLLVDALCRSRQIARIMADIVAGVQPYRGLRRRLLLTREWGLAWGLIRTGWFTGLPRSD
jgi:geranylgeranyl reductase family protein